MTFVKVNGHLLTAAEYGYLNALAARSRTTGSLAAEIEPDGGTPFGRWRALRTLLGLRERRLVRCRLNGSALIWGLTRDAALALGVNRGRR